MSRSKKSPKRRKPKLSACQLHYLKSAKALSKRRYSCPGGTKGLARALLGVLHAAQEANKPK
jgi:hypothetical protein